MPRIRRVNVYKINIAANPHDNGIYERLLTKMSHTLVRVRGSDAGKLTRPIRHKSYPHLFVGRVLIWTEIDMKARWIDLEKEDEISPELKASISIPHQARPNFRAFDYVFDERKHTLYFESKNDLDETVSPNVVLKIVAAAAQPDALGSGWPEVEVTLVPRKGAVDRILALPRLDHVFIRVVRPNPDGPSAGAVDRVLGKLNQMHAHKIETSLKRAHDAPRLVLNTEYREMAEVGSVNGLVSGKGRNADGTTAELSTVAQPEAIPVEMNKGDTFLARLLSVIPSLV